MNLFLLLSAAQTTEAAQAAESAQSAADTAAGGGNIFGIVLIGLLAVFGGYCVYAALRLHSQCFLFPSKVIYPGNCAPEACTDADGFIRFTVPRLLSMGVLLVLAGALKALNDYLFEYSAPWVYYAELAVPILIFVWYMIVQGKASKRFW